eukprot:Amastigsp_a339495_69.p3 type:complete len:107 gc:universal Amastigsp_a339495_69:657-977(+)
MSSRQTSTATGSSSSRRSKPRRCPSLRPNGTLRSRCTSGSMRSSTTRRRPCLPTSRWRISLSTRQSPTPRAPCAPTPRFLSTTSLSPTAQTSRRPSSRSISSLERA